MITKVLRDFVYLLIYFFYKKILQSIHFLLSALPLIDQIHL